MLLDQEQALGGSDSDLSDMDDLDAVEEPATNQLTADDVADNVDPNIAIQHQAFATINKERRELHNQIKELERTSGKSIAELIAESKNGGRAQPQPVNPPVETPKPQSNPTEDEHKVIMELAHQLKAQQEETVFLEQMQDVVQNLSNRFKWDSKTATKYGNHHQVVALAKEKLQKGFTPQEAAFSIGERWGTKFSRPSNVGQNINPLQKGINPVRGTLSNGQPVNPGNGSYRSQFKSEADFFAAQAKAKK